MASRGRYEPMRLSIRNSLIGLAAVAVGLAAARAAVPILWSFGFADGTYYGPNTGLLAVGQAAVLAEEYRAGPASRAIRPTGRTGSRSTRYDWPAVTPAGDILVAAGTRGVVTIDPAWDDDSCSPGRPIAVALPGGDVVAVPRRILRRP